MNSIKVQGKGIVFANYFAKLVNGERRYAFDVPDEGRYTTYSLNEKEGRDRVAAYLAKTYNCGYLQTGNMDIAVWQHRTRPEVVIVEENELDFFDEAYDDDDNENPDFCKPFRAKELEFKNNYKRLGEVSCTVWRVEFIDQKLLTPDIVVANSAYLRKDVLAKLPKGDYELIEHDLEHDQPEPFVIWMTIKLKS